MVSCLSLTANICVTTWAFALVFLPQVPRNRNSPRWNYNSRILDPSNLISTELQYKRICLQHSGQICVSALRSFKSTIWLQYLRLYTFLNSILWVSSHSTKEEQQTGCLWVLSPYSKLWVQLAVEACKFCFALSSLSDSFHGPFFESDPSQGPGGRSRNLLELQAGVLLLHVLSHCNHFPTFIRICVLPNVQYRLPL